MSFRFENLDIWKESIDYCNSIYNITEKFPKDESFGLKSQLNRAAVSISANIAEGSASCSDKELKMFIGFSIRSLAEVISELVIARNRRYITDDQFKGLYDKGEILIKRITSFKNNLV